MSPRSSRGGCAVERGRWPARRAGGRSAAGCRATGRPAASSAASSELGRPAPGPARPGPRCRVPGARAGGPGRRVPCTRAGRRDAAAPAVHAGAVRRRPGRCRRSRRRAGSARPRCPGRAARAARSQPCSEAMWQSAGSSAVQRPTSLVWVVRVATSCSSSPRCSRQKSAKTGATSAGGLVGDAAHARHGVVVGGQGVLGARQKEEVHRGEQEERPALRQRGGVEERRAARRRRPRPGRWRGR